MTMTTPQMTQLILAIQAVCPILGFTDATATDVIYDPAATDAQKVAAQGILAGWPLSLAKTDQSLIVQAAYESALAAGVTINGITYYASPDAQQLFTAGLTMADTGLLRAGWQPTDMISTRLGQSVWDVNGNTYDMALSDFIVLSLNYAGAVGALRHRLNLAQQSIAIANDIATVVAINF